MKHGLFVILIIAGGFTAPASEWKLDLQRTSPGELPAGFEAAMEGSGAEPEWKVVLDDVQSLLPPLTSRAPSVTRQPVLAEVSQDTNPGRIPMLLLKDHQFADFELNANIKIESGKVAREAGLMFRAQNSESYYVVRLDAQNKAVAFTKISNRIFGDPIAVKADVKTGQWHTLTLRCQGNKINILLDGKQAIPTLTDNSFASGAVGFWTRGDTVAYFSKVGVNFTRRTSLAQELIDDVMDKYSRLLGIEVFSYKPNQPGIHLIASDNKDKVGQHGGKTEEEVITKAAVAYGYDKKVVSVVMPLRDRNGDPVAAVRFRMKRYPGQTRTAAISRAIPLVEMMEKRVKSASDLVR